MRKIVLKNFHHNPHGDCNLYENDLGWHQGDYDEAMASKSADVLRYFLDIGYDVYFFDTKSMGWYFINLNWGPGIELVKMSPRKDWDGRFIEDNKEFHYEGKMYADVVFRCNLVDEFIKGATVGGDPIADVMDRSWIKFS